MSTLLLYGDGLLQKASICYALAKVPRDSLPTHALLSLLIAHQWTPKRFLLLKFLHVKDKKGSCQQCVGWGGRNLQIMSLWCESHSSRKISSGVLCTLLSPKLECFVSMYGRHCWLGKGQVLTLKNCTVNKTMLFPFPLVLYQVTKKAKSGMVSLSLEMEKGVVKDGQVQPKRLKGKGVVRGKGSCRKRESSQS